MEPNERGAKLAKQLLEKVVSQAEQIQDLQKGFISQQTLIVGIEARMTATEAAYIRVLGILERSIIKIDVEKLGTN